MSDDDEVAWQTGLECGAAKNTSVCHSPQTVQTTTQNVSVYETEDKALWATSLV